MAAGLLLPACTTGSVRAPAPVALTSAETEPVPGRGDAADDPAIWVNRDDPAASLVLGTDKKRGLNVYPTDGLEVTSESPPPPYEQGLLVVQDGSNTTPRAPQNFKLVPWSEVQRALGQER